jgi:MFS family permease
VTAERGLSVRLSLYYVTSIGAVGCAPYLAVLLVDRGVSPSMASAMLSVVPVALMIGGPLWGAVADRIGPIAVLRGAAWAAVALGVALLAAPGAWMAAVLFPWMLARAPFGPLADGLVVQALGRPAYGRVRAVGSGAFFTVALVGGWLRETWPAAPLWISAVLLAANVLVTYGLPRVEVVAHPERPSPLSLVRHRVVGPFLVFAAVHGTVFVCYDNFLAMHVERALRLPSLWAGAAVGAGILCEMAVMFLGQRWLPVIGPIGGLLVSVVLGLPHWALTATVTAPWAFVAVQTLRGACFGTFWVSGVALLSEAAPPGLRGVAQTLLPATSYGLGYLACSAIAAGVLAVADTHALFWAMATIEFVSLGLFAWVWRSARVSLAG